MKQNKNTPIEATSIKVHDDKTIYIVNGHSIDEYKELYGNDYTSGSLSDYPGIDLDKYFDASCDVYWRIYCNDEVRYYEAPNQSIPDETNNDDVSLEEYDAIARWTAVTENDYNFDILCDETGTFFIDYNKNVIHGIQWGLSQINETMPCPLNMTLDTEEISEMRNVFSRNQVNLDDMKE